MFTYAKYAHQRVSTGLECQQAFGVSQFNRMEDKTDRDQTLDSAVMKLVAVYLSPCQEFLFNVSPMISLANLIVENFSLFSFPCFVGRRGGAGSEKAEFLSR